MHMHVPDMHICTKINNWKIKLKWKGFKNDVPAGSFYKVVMVQTYLSNIHNRKFQEHGINALQI